MASSANRQTLTANGTTTFKRFVGPVVVSLTVVLLGGTAKVQRMDASGATVDVAGTVYPVVGDFVLDYPQNSVNIFAVNLSGASQTSPETSLVIEMTDGEDRKA